MRLSSVVAIVGPRDRRCDHLSLNPRQRTLGRVHDLSIKLRRGPKCVGPQALKANDIEDFAGSLEGSLIKPSEKPIGCCGRNRFDPCHTRNRTQLQ